jgi:hypothetical protein
VTCSVGALAKGRAFELRFKGELDWIEESPAGVLRGSRRGRVGRGGDGEVRGKNAFARAHYAHYRALSAFWDDAKEKLRKLVEGSRSRSSSAATFWSRSRARARRWLAFAPTYKGGYGTLPLPRRQHRPARAQYGVDPAKLGDLVGELEASGLRYVVISDQLLEERSPSTAFYGANKPVHLRRHQARVAAAALGPRRDVPLRAARCRAAAPSV